MMLIGVLFNSHLPSLGRNDFFFLVGCIEENSKEERRQEIQVTTVITCFPLYLPDFV